MHPAERDLSQLHRPVLLGEVLAHLAGIGLDAPGAVFVDGTVGLGGHAQAVLEAYPEVCLLGLDRDPEALAHAGRRLARFGARVRLMKGSYAEVAELLAQAGWPAPRAVLLDVGVSSLQLDTPGRGFSFRGGTALPDMRFDATSEESTAAELVNRSSEADLAQILFEFGGEPKARAVARAIVRGRPFTTVEQLAEVIRRAALRGKRIDPATRSFQGLRIAVNDELGHLERGLGASLGVLAPGGRLLVIAFHSGEERVVKAAFREAARAGRGRVLTKKPIRSSEHEARSNPRARPARLRAFERCEREAQAPRVTGRAVADRDGSEGGGPGGGAGGGTGGGAGGAGQRSGR